PTTRRYPPSLHDALPISLTCTTCHDPHRPTAAMDPDHFNAACRSCHGGEGGLPGAQEVRCTRPSVVVPEDALTGDCVGCHMQRGDRKSTRLNSSHVKISY